MVSGTTLTYHALIFIAFAYETSELTWREIPEKFCTEEDRIAHSTLYKAVHGFGAAMKLQEESVKEGIERLKSAYLTKTRDEEIIVGPGYPRCKALLKHTQIRENAVNQVLTLLVSCCRLVQGKSFTESFYKYIRPSHLIISALDPPILKLYRK